MVLKKNGDRFLMDMAARNELDPDKMTAAWLILGDDLFVLLRLFEGQTLKVPSKRRLNFARKNSAFFIEDDKRKWRDWKKGEYLEYDDKSYLVLAPERKILNHWYIPVVDEDSLDEEEDCDEQREQGS